MNATPAAPATATQKPVSGTRRRRGVLSGLALVLACLTIVLATTALWVHQVVLNTDRFTALAANIVTEPAVTDPLATRVSQQIVTALDVQGRVANRLPDAAKALAGPMTVAVQQAMERRLQDALRNPKVQAALLTTLSFTHEHLVALLRGQSDAITVANGYVQLNVFPVVGTALEQLQSIGLIPADVALPDLTSDEAPAALAARLESALGITLPADFGTIQLMPADNLTMAQTVVKVFDLVVIALIVLSVVLALLAIWLAQRRRRMVVYLALGTIIAFILVRFSARGLPSAVAAGIQDQGIAGALRTVIESVAADFVRLTSLILVATAAICIVAYIAGRPAWLVRLTSRSAGAVSSTAARTAAAAGDARSRTDVASTVRANRPAIERFGIGAIAFAVVWLAVGFEVALLGLALVVAWLLIVRIVSSEPDAAAEPAAQMTTPASSQGPAGPESEPEAVTAT